MYVLHLLSGHRRPLDFQAHMEALLDSFPTRLFVLSIDIANHPVFGDLTNGDSVHMWLELLRSGRVAAVLAGPPCESWSVARHRPAPDARRPPRPLRSSTRLWGLGHLTKRESLQVTLANRLLRTAISFLYECWRHGIPAVM